MRAARASAEVPRSAHPVDRPVATLFAGCLMLGISALGFVFVAGDAHDKHVSASTAVRLLLASGLVGASMLAIMSFRLLHKSSRPNSAGSQPALKKGRAAAAGIGFGVATVLLALTGPVSYVAYGLLFGAVAAASLIALGRATVALLRRGSRVDPALSHRR